MHLPYFQDLLNLGNNDRTEGKDVYNAEVMLKHKANRWHESVNTNPYFFNSAFGGLVVTTAAERFVAEFAANNTADADGEYPLSTWHFSRKSRSLTSHAVNISD